MLQQVLVIPSDRSLRRERSKLQLNKIGLQKSVINRIANALQKADKECDRMTILAFDEMTIKGSFALNTISVTNCYSFLLLYVGNCDKVLLVSFEM